MLEQITITKCGLSSKQHVIFLMPDGKIKLKDHWSEKALNEQVEQISAMNALAGKEVNKIPVCYTIKNLWERIKDSDNIWQYYGWTEVFVNHVMSLIELHQVKLKKLVLESTDSTGAAKHIQGGLYPLKRVTYDTGKITDHLKGLVRTSNQGHYDKLVRKYGKQVSESVNYDWPKQGRDEFYTAISQEI